MPFDAGAPVRFRPLAGDSEIRAVLRLQAANHPSALSAEAMASEGFVTVRHDVEVLRRMSQVAPGSVAVAEERVVGYALVMPRTFADDVPILAPLFAMLETLSWKDGPLATNPRSLRAHARVGFETLHVYPDETTGEQWHVIALDFASLLYPGSGA